MQEKDEPDCLDSPIFHEVLTLGQVIIERFCSGCGKEETLVTSEEENECFSITTCHGKQGFNRILDCMSTRFKIQYIEPPDAASKDSNVTNRCAKCNQFSLLEKNWLKYDQLDVRQKKVLILNIHPITFEYIVADVDDVSMNSDIDNYPHVPVNSGKFNRNTIELKEQQKVRAELEIDITNFIHQSYKLGEKKVVGSLTGYISRDNARELLISVTLNDQEGNFYLSDDMNPYKPKNLGKFLLQS